MERRQCSPDIVSATSPTTPPPSPESLIRQTHAYVQDYMSPSSRFDASHDYEHVLRVLALCGRILHVERGRVPEVFYDDTVVTLSALLHDVDDRKYPPSFSSPSCSASLSFSPSNPTPFSILTSLSCPTQLARTVQTVVSALSYSTETQHPALIQRTLSLHPELAIVQDADRLDALGAVGIARAFTFGGVRGRALESTVAHFEEKLDRLEGMMKTCEGRRLASERSERLRVWKGWWREEVGLREGEGEEGGEGGRKKGEKR